MLRDMLNLTGVSVQRITETDDGMGGIISSVETIIISGPSAIWMSGSSSRWLSDRITRASTHVLACEPSAYTWTQDDRNVTYGGATYKIIGRPENIMQMDEICTIPLELVT
jgi:hypothetical protein